MNWYESDQKHISFYQNSLAYLIDPEKKAHIWGIIGNRYLFGLLALSSERESSLWNEYAAGALRAHENILTLFPNNIHARNNMAIIMMLTESNRDKALKYLRKLANPIIKSQNENINRNISTIRDPAKMFSRDEKSLINVYDKYISAFEDIKFYEMERLALKGIVAYLTGDIKKTKLYFAHAYKNPKHAHLKAYSMIPRLVIGAIGNGIGYEKVEELKVLLVNYRGISDDEEDFKQIIKNIIIANISNG